MLTVGDVVPDLEFTGPDGETVSLASFRGQPLLLIFLRHLG